MGDVDFDIRKKFWIPRDQARILKEASALRETGRLISSRFLDWIIHSMTEENIPADAEPFNLIAHMDEIRDTLRQVRITQVASFWHTSARPKFIGKNAVHDVHGRETLDYFVRIATDRGFEGLGTGRITDRQGQAMIGHSLDAVLHPELGIASPLGRADHALYDLIGKVLRRPSWQLLGGQGTESVPIYDSSIYFSDLLPENLDQGVGPILREVENSLKQGHRAFKIKIGRGHKWMNPNQGFQRDVEVVQAIRKLTGPDVQLMVDANNSFDLETTQNFLDATGGEFLFLEEMFPENVEQDLALKAFIEMKDWKSLVADGESALEPGAFEPFIEQRALDVLQPDIRVFGMSLAWQLSRRIAETPLQIATHNWGSWLAIYPQVVLGRGIGNFLIAEHDPGGSGLYDDSAYEFKEGRIRVPDEPGFGIRIRENVFRDLYGVGAWVSSSGN